MSRDTTDTATVINNDMGRQEDDTVNNREIECGIGYCREIKFLQRLANKNVYVVIYGILGCLYGSTYSYFNSSISTIEKRFKIPSKITGFIMVGNDISSLLATMILSYYAGKGHRPRWIAVGIYSVALYCFINLLPHLLWGPGEDALALTLENRDSANFSQAAEILLTQKRKTLCRAGLNDSLAGSECLLPGAASENGNTAAAIFFLANFISGIGGSLYYTLGVSYMDDNIKKAKTPFLVSISYFMRMLAPALGYTLGSYFLKMYISPSLTPTITNDDPRWLGAWWAGWLIFGIGLTVLGSIIGMFPQTLPKTVQRKKEVLEKSQAMNGEIKQPPEIMNKDKPSIKDMMQTIRRLLSNKIYICNTLSSIFYFFGFMPFWVYTPKYMEVQYHITASKASFLTGSVGLVFSAIGVLLAGYIITRFKPRARYLAGWNVIVAVISVAATLIYPFIGCEQSDLQNNQMASYMTDLQPQCNRDCRCDYVKYSPVCSEDGRTTFTSACHAGCKDHITQDGKKIYTDCSCIPGGEKFQLPVSTLESNTSLTLPIHSNETMMGGRAFPGPCPVDCTTKLYIYIALVCLLKFSGATGRTSNFLVSVRCVEEKDKATSLGFGMMLMNFFVFIPSPIIFGYIIDSTCLVWGQTCSGTGNCWQYDGEAMRILLNFTASVFITIGTLLDVGVWYYVKDLLIFDKEDEQPTVQKKKVYTQEESDEPEQKELLDMSKVNNNISHDAE